MMFLILTALIGTLFLLNVPLNIVEKSFFIGVYFLSLAMEIGSIIIEIKNPSKEDPPKNVFIRLWNKIKTKKNERKKSYRDSFLS